MMKVILSAISLLLAATSVVTASDKPNILFIAIDDLRPELSCYGGAQVKSPHLDKLAKQGIQFDRAYCQVAVCGASRASLMTGVLPTKQRFKSYLTRVDEDTPDAATLPEVFKNAGYTTISNGKIFHHRNDSDAKSWSEKPWRSKDGGINALDPASMKFLSGKKRGRIYELPDVADNAYGDGQTAERTIADLQRLKKSGKPFFLACGFVKPHMPFYAPKKYWDLYKRDEIKLAVNRFRPKNAPKALKGSKEYMSYHLAGMDVESDEFHRVMRHGYLACISYVDKLVGDVLAEVDRLGLAENTIIVVWGDHGWHLGEHDFWGKHNTMHLATRVPLIVKVPGKISGTSQSLVETSDVFPTLCELAKLPIPSTVQGKSFVSLLDDPSKPFRSVAYTRFGGGDAVVSENFNYTRYGNKSEMLYDLQKDPEENTNVSSNPDYAATLDQMRKHLTERMLEADGAIGLGQPKSPKLPNQKKK